MTACEICETLAQQKDVLKKTRNVAVLLPRFPVVEGHVQIVPLRHAAIAEQIDDKEIGELFSTANKVSTLLFEQMGAQGTNILVQNGLAAGQKVNHVVIEVIPRKQDDGINLQWQPKQLSEEEMNHLEFTLKEELKNAESAKPKNKTLSLDESEPVSKEPETEGSTDLISETSEDKKEKQEPDEDYELKQLRRIP